MIDGENKIVGVVDYYKYYGDFFLEYNVIFFYEFFFVIDMFNFYFLFVLGILVVFEEEVNCIVVDVIGKSDFIIEYL